MIEPRGDMLPDSPPAEVTPPAPAPASLEPAPAKPGQTVVVDTSKPPAGFVPLGAIQTERDKRQKAESDLAIAQARLAELESGGVRSENEVFSDEGKAIMETVGGLQRTIADFQKKEAMREVLIAFPQVGDKRTEFEQFMATKPGYSMMDAAKLFIVEAGIIVTDAPPTPRKGVEKPTGGSRLPPKTGMSPEEVDDLRINHPRKFIQMIRDGRINPDDIK